MNRLGILISGRGSNMVSLLEAVRSGYVPAEAALVLSNRDDAPGLEKARSFGVETTVVPQKEFRGRPREEHDRAAVAVLRGAGADTICLAGYMRILSLQFIESFPGRIINIHPALLPSFPGLHAQRQALEAGVRVTGCTVHFVDAEVDHGPPIIQAAVPVLGTDDEDALSSRILEQEHRIYPQACRWLCQGRLRVDGGRVMLDDEQIDAPSSIVSPLAD